MSRFFKRFAKDHAELATELDMAVNELRYELGSCRSELAEFRAELHAALEAVMAGHPQARIDRLRKQLTESLNLTLPDE